MFVRTLVAFRLLVPIVLLFSVSPAVAKDKFGLMFAAQWDLEAIAYVKNAFNENDYLRADIGNGRSINFVLPASIFQISKHATNYCAKTKGMVIYDPEHWDATPKEELADLGRSAHDAVSLTRNSGCQSFGIAPDGITIGVQPQTCIASVSETINKVDWRKIDLVVIQGQRLLSDQCVKCNQTTTYSEFVKNWAIELKRRNPDIKIFSSMSFRHTDAATMDEALMRVRPYIDGLYLAYPKSTAQNECKYCTVDQLKAVVESARR